MSNSLAIAAVTAALRDLLGQVATSGPIEPNEPKNPLGDTHVTTLPLDKAGQDEHRNQLNLFLALTTPNITLRNADPRRLGRGEETGPPPLALDLIYLITAFGKDGDEMMSHRLLGRAMSLIHAHPTLTSEQMNAALPGSDGERQSVRLVPFKLPIEELSKLWGMFQIKYRLTAAFQASIVLIDGPTTPAASPVKLMNVKVQPSAGDKLRS